MRAFVEEQFVLEQIMDPEAGDMALIEVANFT
jgi:hypothetical protein